MSCVNGNCIPCTDNTTINDINNNTNNNNNNYYYYYNNNNNNYYYYYKIRQEMHLLDRTQDCEPKYDL